MSKPTVVIKKYEEEGHGGHHGGGWKVAYADFMTAMMAFFLLLWILAASDEEALRGLADYFTPSLSEAGGKGHGLLAGQVLAEDGVLSGTDGPKSEEQLPSFGQENPLAVFDSRLRYDEKFASAASPDPGGANSEENGLSNETTEGVELNPSPMRGVQPEEVDGTEDTEALEDNLEASLAELIEAENERVEELDAVVEEILEQLGVDPALAEFAENLSFEITPEGLEIQLIDGGGRSMFGIGSAAINERARSLVSVVANSIKSTPWPISISGHTDSLAYGSGNTYTNWELSADRANATRRVLSAEGVAATRIKRITGFAATDPLEGVQASAPENRRIAILMHYPSQMPPALRNLEAELGPQ